MTKQELTVKLASMSVEDLLQINKNLVAIIKEKQRMNNRTASFNFMTGDKVSYMSGRFGTRETAVVLEVKRTKVLVESLRGRFLVPASMLSSVN